MRLALRAWDKVGRQLWECEAKKRSWPTSWGRPRAGVACESKRNSTANIKPPPRRPTLPGRLRPRSGRLGRIGPACELIRGQHPPKMVNLKGNLGQVGRLGSQADATSTLRLASALRESTNAQFLCASRRTPAGREARKSKCKTQNANRKIGSCSLPFVLLHFAFCITRCPPIT